jgi:hypothetical protein
MYMLAVPLAVIADTKQLAGRDRTSTMLGGSGNPF